jgi:integrase
MTPVATTPKGLYPASDLLGPDGRPAPFDTSLVTPYALRHSYAQRHADAGVPVDVLRELMDHVAVATTMGYYNPRELHQTGVTTVVLRGLAA